MLHSGHGAPDQPDDGSAPHAGGWLSGLRSHPVAGLLLSVASGWWRSHPLHSASSMTRGAVGTWVQRHPVLTVLGAVALGALVVRAKPWRWLTRRPVMTGMATYMLRSALRYVPIGSLLRMVSRWALSSAKRAAAPRTSRPHAPDARPPSAPLH